MDVTPEFAGQLRDFFMQGLAMEQQTTLNVVGAMPDDGLAYRPHDQIMEFGNLARHIAGSGEFFVKLIQDGKVGMEQPPEPPPLPATTAALVDELGGMFAKTMDEYKKLTPEQLANPIDFFGMGALPGVCYMGWDANHLIHHRAQLAMYLRIAGHKVPSIYGPTLDVSFEEMMGACEGEAGASG